MNLDGLPYIVEPVKLEDVPTVAEIERAVFSMPWSANAFKYELRHNPSAEYLMLRYAPWVVDWRGAASIAHSLRRILGSSEHDASILGYGGLWMMFDEAHICTLGLRGSWRGRGLGELLLAMLVERAIVRTAEVVTLEVRVTNTVAQSLYTKYGFKVVGRRKGYYSDNGEDAFIMTTDPIGAPDYRQRIDQLTAQLRQRLLRQPNSPPQPEGLATPV